LLIRQEIEAIREGQQARHNLLRSRVLSHLTNHFRIGSENSGGQAEDLLVMLHL
jgi:hypothetical protein